MFLQDLPLDVLKYHIFSSASLDIISIQICRLVCKRLAAVIALRQIPKSVFPEFCNTAARLGYFNLLIWIYQLGVRPGPKTLAHAISGGHLDVCNWLVCNAHQTHKYVDISDFDPSDTPIATVQDAYDYRPYFRTSVTTSLEEIPKFKTLDIIEGFIVQNPEAYFIEIGFNDNIRRFRLTPFDASSIKGGSYLESAGTKAFLPNAFIPLKCAVYTILTVFIRDESARIIDSSVTVIGGNMLHLPIDARFKKDFPSVQSWYTGDERPTHASVWHGSLMWDNYQDDE